MRVTCRCGARSRARITIITVLSNTPMIPRYTNSHAQAAAPATPQGVKQFVRRSVHRRSVDVIIFSVPAARIAWGWAAARLAKLPSPKITLQSWSATTRPRPTQTRCSRRLALSGLVSGTAPGPTRTPDLRSHARDHVVAAVQAPATLPSMMLVAPAARSSTSLR